MPNANPKRNTFKDLIQVFKFTIRGDRKVLPLMLLVLAIPVGIGIWTTVLWGTWFYIIIGLLAGVLFALILMTRFADKVGFAQIEGQPGAAGAVLNGITTAGWEFAQEPTQIDQKSMSMVFRGCGRPGVVLVAEGTKSKAAELLKKEKTRIQRVLPEVNIITYQLGNDEYSTPLTKLRKSITKNKVTLTKTELIAVKQRLNSLGTFKMPIPKGIDPTRMKVKRK